MKQLFKVTVLPALFLLITLNSTNAAFPTGKKNKQSISLTADKPGTSKITKNASKAQLKSELKHLVSKDAPMYSGGGKSKIVAALLAFFLGGLGVHSFYMGQKKKGFIQLGVTLAGLGLYVAGIASFISGSGAAFPVLALIGLILVFGVSVWAFIDFIRILTGGLAPEEGFDD